MREPPAVARPTLSLLLTPVLPMLFSAAHAADLSAGDPAPGFALVDQDGETRRLADYRGRWVVLYFYPKDDTPGCTSEACAFRDDILELRAMDVAVLGVSLDDAHSHARFAEKHGLPFPLLADTRGETARAYGSLWGVGPIKLAKRHTFVVDPEGRIAKVYRKVDPKTHSARVIGDLKALSTGAPQLRSGR
jgi:peroxiredoxin Q/BCP